MLDMGGPRSRHRYVALLARKLEACSTVTHVTDMALSEAEDLASHLFTKPADSSAEAVRRALELVAKRYATRLRDAEVAQELGLSPSHFRYVFRQQTSKPFHQYLLGYRLSRAKDLLRTTQLSVQQVSQSCGFTSQAHFCRAFAKANGAVPTAYRHDSRGDPAQST
jgi:AraC-like DNA-binding protein